MTAAWSAPLLLLVVIPVAGSWLGGWRDLARSYPQTEPPDREHRFLFQSASLRRPGWLLPMSYGGCLSAWVAAGGVGLATLPLRLLFHPPLFLPWQALSDCRRQRVGFSECTVVCVARPAVCLHFYGALGQQVFTSYQRYLAAPAPNHALQRTGIGDKVASDLHA